MLPHVILHNSVSLDGRVTGFAGDMGLYYEISARFAADAHLTGSGTMLAAQGEIPPEDESAFQPPPQDPNDTRALLVVVDSQGRLRHWHYLRQMPYWRGFVALCSRSTPSDYLDYLEKRHIDYIIAGDDRVDLRAALEELNSRYGAKTVHLDSGGTLNGAMLRAGLVNEISVLVYPCLVGDAASVPLFHTPDSTRSTEPVMLKLTHTECLNDHILWLRYDVLKEVSSKL